MYGAIQLHEQQQGVAAAMVAIVMEENEQTNLYREKYPGVTAIIPRFPRSDLQKQCHAQRLESFASYDPALGFPV